LQKESIGEISLSSFLSSGDLINEDRADHNKESPRNKNYILGINKNLK